MMYGKDKMAMAKGGMAKDKKAADKKGMAYGGMAKKPKAMAKKGKK